MRSSGDDRRPALVRLPASLTALFPGAPPVVELPPGSVNELIDALDARWPGMRDRLCDSSPAVRRHVNVFVNGARAKLDATVPPEADVHILTAISGG